MRTKIAAVIIARNEEQVLGRCLESVENLDEIVVLDTGSTDGTKEVARSKGARVFDQQLPWPGGRFHFAQARNEALRYPKCDWVLSLDADEILREGSVWAMTKHVGCTRHVAWSIRYVLEPTPGGEGGILPKTTLFRKDFFRWKYRYHEALESTRPGVHIGDLHECVVEHHPIKRAGEDPEYSLKMLEITVKESPEHYWAWKQYAREHLNRKNFGQAQKAMTFVKDMFKEEPRLERSETLISLARAYAGLDRLEECIETFEEAHRAARDRREPLYLAGLELMKRGILWEAVTFFEKAAAIPRSAKPDFYLNLEPVWGTLVEENLAFCREELERVKALHEKGKANEGEKV